MLTLKPLCIRLHKHDAYVTPIQLLKMYTGIWFAGHLLRFDHAPLPGDERTDDGILELGPPGARIPIQRLQSGAYIVSLT